MGLLFYNCRKVDVAIHHHLCWFINKYCGQHLKDLLAFHLIAREKRFLFIWNYLFNNALYWLHQKSNLKVMIYLFHIY